MFQIILNRKLNELMIIAKYAKQHVSKQGEERRGEERRGKKKRKKRKSFTTVVIVLQLLPPPLAGRFWRLYPWRAWIKVRPAEAY